MTRKNAMRKGALALFLALGIFVYAGTLSAQSGDKEAKLHYKQGVAFFKEGNYKMALAEFLKSDELKSNWKLKLNIGICYYNLNRFIKAKNVLIEYLDEGGGEVSEDKKDKANDLLEKISKVLADVKIETNVENATVYVDDKEIAQTPMKKPFTLKSGLYSIRIEADGYKPYVKDISLAGGDSKVLDVTLIKKGGKAPVEDTGGEKGDEKEGEKEPAPKEKKKLSGLAIGAIVTGGLALGAWGGAAGAGVVSKNTENDYNDKDCQSLSDNKECDDLKDKGELSRNVFNYAMLPLAAVLSATSIVLGVVTIVKQQKEKKIESNRLRILNVGLSKPSGDSSGMMLSVSGEF